MRAVAVLFILGLLLTGAGVAAATDAEASDVPGASPSPSQERPLTTDELLALQAELAPVRPPMTVIAEASIGDDTAVGSGPLCPRGREALCVIGVLKTTDGTRSVVVADRDVRDLYQRPHRIEGLLAFRLDGTRTVFLGRVAVPADRPLVAPVSPETMAWADETNAGELIVVDGWLTVLGWGVPCPAPPQDIIGDVSPEDSPFARCPAGWITADPTMPEQSPDRMVMRPPGFGIPVQASAYWDYAPDPGETVDWAPPPRQGRYLLRHVGVNDGPPTGWQVVGRLESAGTPDGGKPAMTAESAPSPAPSQVARPTTNELAIFSSAIKSTVMPWLEAEPTYAGTRLDPETGQLVVSLTRDDPAVVAKLDARVPGGRAGWRLEPAAYTWQQLKAATRAAVSAAGKPRSGLPAAKRLESSWIEVEENRVGLRFERGAIKRGDIAVAEDAWARALGVPIYIWREEIAPSEPLAGEWTAVPDAPWGAANAIAVAVDGTCSSSTVRPGESCGTTRTRADGSVGQGRRSASTP